MPIPVIANPTAGRGRAARILTEINSVMCELGLQPKITVTAHADDLRRSIARARDEGAARVIVCGGDGTIHLAVQELAGSDTALGIVPAGTGDDNARLLGIPRRDVPEATRLAAAGRASRVDLGHVRTADGTSRHFLGVLSSGFDSLVNERANAMTRPQGDARYLMAIVAELRTFVPLQYRAVIDGRRVEGEAMLVAVGNGRSYGGGMLVCPDGDPDDGMLEVTWLHGVSRATFLRVFPRVFSGGHVRSRHVSTMRAQSIRLESHGQIAYADGERIGPLPADIAIERGALAVARGTADA